MLILLEKSGRCKIFVYISYLRKFQKIYQKDRETNSVLPCDILSPTLVSRIFFVHFEYRQFERLAINLPRHFLGLSKVIQRSAVFQVIYCSFQKTLSSQICLIV